MFFNIIYFSPTDTSKFLQVFWWLFFSEAHELFRKGIKYTNIISLALLPPNWTDINMYQVSVEASFLLQ